MPTTQSKPEAQLDSPITIINGLGPKTARSFEKLGVFVLEDLFYFVPRRSEDRRRISKIRNIVLGDIASVYAEITYVVSKRGGTEARIKDRKDKNDKEYREVIARACWFSYKIAYSMKKGTKLALHGQVFGLGNMPTFFHPEYEILSGDEKSSIIGCMFNVYPGTADLTQNTIKKFVTLAANDYAEKLLNEFVPEDVLARHKLPSLCNAVRMIHSPTTDTMYIKARSRLVFNEFFLLQTGMRMLRRQQTDETCSNIIKPGEKFGAFMQSLPFELTKDQKTALSEILNDINKPEPMNRLLQGDVGSGKTIIAAAVMIAASDSGTQSALMVPTEILAQQHYIKLRQYIEPLGLKAVLLTGGLTLPQRRKVLDEIASGEANIIIGTHSLFSDAANFFNLALVIIDEQHKFGVLQRKALISKGEHPHVLAMTATPIPRTLTMTVYGNLDLSSIKELPPGRQKVETISMNQAEYRKIIKMIRKHTARHEQVYWVCPLITEGKSDLDSVNDTCGRLRDILPEIRIEAIHGKMSVKDRAEIMSGFAAGNIDVLVATTVIEVVIDVPNATLIVIDEAGQFGLAQLHQLRGRVGRGQAKSTCVLLENLSLTVDGINRIAAMKRLSDGFELANEDLRQRGTGEFCGTHQHGVTEFKVADLSIDGNILAIARDEAINIINEDPDLQSCPMLKDEIFRRLGDVLELAVTS